MLANGHEYLPETGGTPIVCQVHEAAWFDPHLRELLDARFLKHLEPRTRAGITGADRVITPSNVARDDIIEAYSLRAESVHAIPHGCDSVFNAEGEAPGGFVLPDPFVLFASALHPRKNLAAAAEAVSILRARGYPHQLVVVGGPAADREPVPGLNDTSAESLKNSGGLLHLSGPSDEDLAGIMRSAVLFCLPSFYEGFGLMALESLGCGTPAVVSDRGALPEVVGDGGLAVPPTGEAVAEALATLIDDEPRRTAMREAGISRARHLTWSRAADGWADVLERAVEDAP